MNTVTDCFSMKRLKTHLLNRSFPYTD